MSLALIYITVPSIEVGQIISHGLLEENLIACANLVKGVSSFYRWEGKLESSEESILLLKSQMHLFHKIEQKVKELHPYDCPAIVGVPIENASQDFLKWVVEETAQDMR